MNCYCQQPDCQDCHVGCTCYNETIRQANSQPDCICATCFEHYKQGIVHECKK